MHPKGFALLLVCYHFLLQPTAGQTTGQAGPTVTGTPPSSPTPNTSTFTNPPTTSNPPPTTGAPSSTLPNVTGTPTPTLPSTAGTPRTSVTPLTTSDVTTLPTVTSSITILPDATSNFTTLPTDASNVTIPSTTTKPPTTTTTTTTTTTILPTTIAVCADGFYRQPPTSSCSPCTWECGGNTPCDKRTGACDQCPVGKRGSRCDQDCGGNRYGPNRCSLPCGRCEGDAQCDPVNGHCPSCQPGWSPPLCQECQAGVYGAGCSSKCGQCRVNTFCNKVSGECPQGCAEGYSGQLCMQECQAGVYGAGCSSKCGQCRVNTFCNKVSGECPQGCAEGYSGQLCMQAAATDDRSKIVIAGAVTGILLFAVVAAVIVIIITIVLRRRRSERKSTASADAEHAEILDSREAGNGVDADGKPAQSAGSNENVVNTPHNKPETNRASMSQTHRGGSVMKGKPLVRKDKEPNGETENAQEPSPDYEEEVTDFTNKSTSVRIQPTTFRLDELHETIAAKLRNGTFSDEFGRLTPNKDFSVNFGKREEHHFKNRFLNILPFDKNRVELEEVDDDDSTDYINASFIKGFKSEKAYIATQGPKPNTVDDFWRMIWQVGVTDIVMLTKLEEHGKIKCHEYWPALGNTLEAGLVDVTAVEEETRAHYVIRTFELSDEEGEDKRRVTQYHYFSWVDHEVPAAIPLVDFWRYVRARAPRAPSAPPLLVHCSDGVGRTGTYIALDVTIDHVPDNTELDVYTIVQRLRDDRCHMVQNTAQYVFLHEAVLEAYNGRYIRMNLLAMDIVFAQDIHLSEPHSRVDAEFETLCKMRDYQQEPTYTTANLPENVDKNRNNKILPNDRNLVYLTQHIEGRNQYINAVSKTTFKKHRGCIMAQLPLPDTAIDMWRLVDGYDVNTIVSIGDGDEYQGKACYWPQMEGSSLLAGPYKISQKYMSTIGDTICSYVVAMRKNNTSRDVRVLHLFGWTGEVADSTDDLVYLLTTLQAAAKDSAGPVVLQCIDGASNSGVVCALSDVISRMTRDEELDVYAAVRQLHAARPEALTSLTQYRYCYQVAQHFRKSDFRKSIKTNA